MIDKAKQIALRSLNAWADELESEIRRATEPLSAELARVRLLISQVSKGSSIQPVLPIPSIVAGDDFVGRGPQGAVEQFLRSHAEDFHRPVDIRRRLETGGFTVKTPRLLGQAVAVACQRAVGKKLVEEGEIDGKRAFRWISSPNAARKEK